MHSVFKKTAYTAAGFGAVAAATWLSAMSQFIPTPARLNRFVEHVEAVEEFIFDYYLED